MARRQESGSSQNTSSFLKQKIGHLKLRHILYGEWEAYLFWIVKSIPGIPGFVLRTLVAKVLFKQLFGMAYIQPNVVFVYTNRLKVGKSFGVNSGTYINAIGGIDIGDYVLLGPNVTISSGIHPIEARYPPIFTRPTVPKPIVIGNDVWIGANAVIMPGVTLGEGTVVGANAVVTRDTEPYSVMVGAPARKVRNR
ncbi:acyltransferase [Cohnella sp. LGH]|uniref:acyltransferase n=1 Tax=Cohnella sp. LGH TaxID=1619153 RepID=UPI001AD96EF5|nr:acyltransferase [Cohnella sp. LGH]QTH42318.1 acyltransferase [Cohnella sp. LGH]